MQYLITFLEGLVSFLSPCMLPMLPVYLMYFSGSQKSRKSTLLNAGAFVLGFTIIFTLMGIFAGTLGHLLTAHALLVRIFSGVIIILFGLSETGIFELTFLKGYSGEVKITGIFSAFLFGVVYAVCLTPCIGIFLGSALMLASVSASAYKGAILLIVYSLGLGIPFFISAVLIEELENTFDFIKKHYAVINKICGIFLIFTGIAIILRR